MFELRVDEKTALRLLEVDQAEEIFALVAANRAYLRRWMPWLDATRSSNDISNFIERMRAQYKDRTGFTTGLWHAGRLAGIIGHNSLDWSNRIGYIGYWLGAEYGGRGIMTTACRALITHAFEDMGLNRVEIRCAVKNKRSRAIPERLGFHHEGTFSEAEWLYDHFVDHAVYAMLASRWPHTPPPVY